MAWLNQWSNALDESDAAIADLSQAKQDKHAHIEAGHDAEPRRRMLSGFGKVKRCLAPLTLVLKQMAATAAARATKRKQKTTPEASPMDPTP